MPEEKSSSRATLSTVIATAAVTVAVGVTAAALGGYIVPARDQASLSAAAPGNESPNATEPQPAVPSSEANVVLVPVAPDMPAANLVEAEPGLVLARYEAHEREEHRGRNRDHHEEHEDGDEHDDD